DGRNRDHPRVAHGASPSVVRLLWHPVRAGGRRTGARYWPWRLRSVRVDAAGRRRVPAGAVRSYLRGVIPAGMTRIAAASTWRGAGTPDGVAKCGTTTRGRPQNHRRD